MTVPLGRPGPAQSDFLVHFCGRPLGSGISWDLDSAIADMQPWKRLESILWDGVLKASKVFRSGDPVICFSECTEEHFTWLLTDRRFPAWGLMFTRQEIYDLGGGPVWYARTEQFDELPRDLWPWAVRFQASSPKRSDWLHEREWRIPFQPPDIGLALSVVKPHAVLVGEADWRPAPRADSDDIWAPSQMPELWSSVPRYYWDPATKEFCEVPM